MKKKKTETFTYEGLGFPIELVDVPMKKMCGEWVIDIDMNKLQTFVFKALIHKPFRLSGKEIKFMRKFVDMTTTELGKKLGFTHAAVVKWEKEQVKINPSLEIYLRMFFLKRFNNKDKNLIKIFDEIKPEKLMEMQDEESPSLSLGPKEFREAI